MPAVEISRPAQTVGLMSEPPFTDFALRATHDANQFMHPLFTAVSRRAKVILLLCSVGASLPISAGLLSSASPSLAWFLDLGAHWQWLYASVGAACVIWLFAFGAYIWALPGALALTIGWFIASPERATAEGTTGASLTVVTANLNAENPDPSALLRWAKDIGADIIVLQEVSPRTALELKKWGDHSHRIVVPQEGPFGLGILSRHPLESNETREPAGQTLHIRTHILWGDTRIALSAVHPMPPVSTAYHAQRVALFKTESKWAASTGLPAIISGDFNASPWSSAMEPFTAQGLQRASGPWPTWPAAFPLIPIDQVVVSGHWRVMDAEVGPAIGSDHRPVRVQLAPG